MKFSRLTMIKMKTDIYFGRQCPQKNSELLVLGEIEYFLRFIIAVMKQILALIFPYMLPLL